MIAPVPHTDGRLESVGIEASNEIEQVPLRTPLGEGGDKIEDSTLQAHVAVSKERDPSMMRAIGSG
jgi:hypothetical protein